MRGQPVEGRNHIMAQWWNGGIGSRLLSASLRCPCVAGVFNPGTFTWGPRNSATGHMSVSWIEQSLTSCQTAWSNVEWGSRSPSSQPSHARNNCQALRWICHIRCTVPVSRASRSALWVSSPSCTEMTCTRWGQC